jgi:hypothetical protein
MWTIRDYIQSYLVSGYVGRSPHVPGQPYGKGGHSLGWDHPGTHKPAAVIALCSDLPRLCRNINPRSLPVALENGIQDPELP